MAKQSMYTAQQCNELSESGGSTAEVNERLESMPDLKSAVQQSLIINQQWNEQLLRNPLVYLVLYYV